MKKLYFFSQKKLQYVEITNLKSKLIYTFLTTFILAGLVLFGCYTLIASPKNIKSLQTENEVLRKKVGEILTLYSKLNVELDSLTSANNTLRIAVNLQPVSKEEMRLGVGGGYFDNSIDFLGSNSSLKLDEALSYADEAARKLSFEKAQYEDISRQLKKNQKLSNCIPAIKPVKGYITSDFGTRMHPILHRKRMHDGIDLIVNTGTPVHSTGDGYISYVGRRGGYGLTVEVNHGFGYKTVYAHLSKAKVKRGQKISRGDVIAESGNTGLSTGPHLHYEVQHNGKKLDPKQFFFDGFNYFATAK